VAGLVIWPKIVDEKVKGREKPLEICKEIKGRKSMLNE
jgi:hypothetical protein